MTGSSASRPTLSDVARAAGVSIGLASMCLRGVAGPAEETRAFVRQVADDLGYRPNKAASVLAQTRVRRLGVVFALRRALHAHIVEELYRASAAVGYELLLSATSDERPAITAAESLIDSRCQAIMLIGASTDERTQVKIAGTAPTILIGGHAPLEGVSSVRANGFEGVQLAFRHLVGLGHRRIWFVRGPDSDGTRDRLEGYLDAMAALEDPSLVHVIAGGETMESGIVASREIIGADPRPTAVVVHNDECAAGVVFGLKIREVNVPEHVSVVGFDDSGFASQSGLQLTTLHQDVTSLAKLAVAEATTRREHPESVPVRTKLAPELRVRKSTGRAPGAT